MTIRKRKKQVIGLLTAAAVIFAASACGDQEAGQAAGGSESSAVSGESTSFEESGNLAASGDSDAETTVEGGDSNSGSDAGDNAVSVQVTVTDMIGREVTVTPASYRRVVCIGAGALRMYAYVGDLSLLCGVEDIDNETLADRPKMFDSVARPYVIAYGEVFESLASCGVGGPNAQTAEAEKILACSPDIIVSEYEDVEKADALQEQLGVPVITLKTGPDGVFDEAFGQTMRLLGQVFGREERAESLLAFVEEQRADIARRTADNVRRATDMGKEDSPAVYICGLGNWGITNHLMTAQNYISFDVANVRNAVTDLAASGIQPIEEEKFVALGEDMDVMIVDAAAVKNIAPLFQEDDGMFDSCKAWREGEVYLQMAYNAYYTNYETALINTWYIGKVVYPDAFADIDMAEKTDEITEMFLGRGLAEEIFACPSSFGGYQKIDTASFFR